MSLPFCEPTILPSCYPAIMLFLLARLLSGSPPVAHASRTPPKPMIDLGALLWHLCVRVLRQAEHKKEERERMGKLMMELDRENAAKLKVRASLV